MKLGRNAASLKIQNQWDVAGMLTTVSKEESTTGPRLPARKFLSILENRIQNINRTTPNVDVTEFVPGNLDPGEEIGRADSMVIGQVVVNVSCIVHCHGPERAVNTSFPVNGRM